MFYIAQKTRQVLGLMVAVCFLFGMSTLSFADAKNVDLIKMLGSENRGWRYSAAMLLGERGVKDAVNPLIEHLKVEKDPSVRVIMVQALHRIGDPRAIDTLKNLAKVDTNRTVRHVAAVVVADMERLAYNSHN